MPNLTIDTSQIVSKAIAAASHLSQQAQKNGNEVAAHLYRKQVGILLKKFGLDTSVLKLAF